LEAPAIDAESASGLRRERRAAAAGAGRVRILDDELGALDAFLVIDFGANQILVAHRIDQERYAVLFHRRVVIVHGLVESEPVLEARAPAPGDEHAELELWVTFLIDEVFHLGC